MSEIYPIAVPKWGIEMVEGTLNAWSKQQGDSVSKGDEVFEMESDKIVNVWDAPVDGVLRRILAKEGDTHPVGALLGVIASAEVEDSAIDAFIADFGKTAGAPARSTMQSTTQGTTDQTASTGASPAVSANARPAQGGAGDAYTRSSPPVRKLAQELDVDLNSVSGTGRRGRITEDDVRAAAADSNPGDSGAPDNVEIIPLSATRKTIGRRLAESKQNSPHFYLTVEYELDGLLTYRNELNSSGDIRVSVNDLIVWCVARALIREPRVNVNLVNDAIHQFSDANISVAIATEDGLYPATLFNADTLTPQQIATEIAGLAEKTRGGTLSKEDISGGSFTVSNLGMFGVSSFTAIINPPMCAILALGKGDQRVVVRDGAPAVATVITATLSCDHRAIDGAVGAAFLQVLGEEIAQAGR